MPIKPIMQSMILCTCIPVYRIFINIDLVRQSEHFAVTATVTVVCRLMMNRSSNSELMLNSKRVAGWTRQGARLLTLARNSSGRTSSCLTLRLRSDCWDVALSSSRPTETRTRNSSRSSRSLSTVPERFVSLVLAGVLIRIGVINRLAAISFLIRW